MSKSLIETHVDSNGLTQLIQRLGRDCTPTQFVREFVQNSIEAVQRAKKPSQILVDVNWDLYHQTGVHKISFVDNGDGMTPEEMLKHLNNLSSSGTDSNVYENYGVGAKIAALTRNHAGIIYESWKGGHGYRMFVYYDEDEQKYGVRRMNIDESGDVYHCLPIDDSHKPSAILEHGTRVTLLGMLGNEDTMLPPSNTRGGKRRLVVFISQFSILSCT